MYILGINTGLNSSAVLMKNNKAVFGIQEERLSKISAKPGIPVLSIREALRFEGIGFAQLDKICISGKNLKNTCCRGDELKKFHTLYSNIKETWFHEKENNFVKPAENDRPEKSIEEYLKENGCAPKHESFDHHLCHAASAYYGLSKDKNQRHLIFSMDGWADGKSSAVFIGHGNRIEEIASSSSFSPACLYTHITYIMGFIPHAHEYKLMGLAPYARLEDAKSAKNVLRRFIGFDAENPLVFNNTPRYPDVQNSDCLKRQALVHDLFKSVLNMRFDTLSAGLQLLAEESAVQWIKAGISRTGIKRVLLSGGFFMNVKVNKLISELPEVEFVDAFPSCGDESNAFGAAFLGYQQMREANSPELEFEGCCIGTDAMFDIEEAKEKYKDTVNFEKAGDINERMVEFLTNRKIVARCSGRMEFGARALGNRSILASPDDMKIINRINAAIKKRDFWMPFAPAVLEDKLDMVVDVPSSLKESYSPYMMFTFNVKPGMQDKIIAGIHQADKTARVQTVNPETYPEFHDIITRFYRKSGIPALLNTSFNLHGYPIVLGACDAINVYLNSELDALVVGYYLITRK
jgi:carbamoyltransferase